MTRPVIIWQDSYALNIDIVDEQHKKLLQIINEINQDDTIFNDDVRATEIVSELKNYTQYHFETEEKLMIEFNSPLYVKHKKLHKQIIYKLDQISTIYKNQPTELLRNMNELLSEMFVDHLLFADKLVGQTIASLYNQKKMKLEV